MPPSTRATSRPDGDSPEAERVNNPNTDQGSARRITRYRAALSEQSLGNGQDGVSVGSLSQTGSAVTSASKKTRRTAAGGGNGKQTQTQVEKRVTRQAARASQSQAGSHEEDDGDESPDVEDDDVDEDGERRAEHYDPSFIPFDQVKIGEIYDVRFCEQTYLWLPIYDKPGRPLTPLYTIRLTAEQTIHNFEAYSRDGLDVKQTFHRSPWERVEDPAAYSPCLIERDGTLVPLQVFPRQMNHEVDDIGDKSRMSEDGLDNEEYESSQLVEEPSSEDQRTQEEKDAVQYEIMELEDEIPISKRYKIVDRLGEGTFSSVYKAIDCKFPFHDNAQWYPQHDPPIMDLRNSIGADTRKYHKLAKLRETTSQDVESSLSFSSASSSTGSTSTAATSMSSGRGKVRYTPYSALVMARKELKRRADVKSLDKSQGGSPVYVALKRIYVTSSPQRIQNELELLADLRNARNTAYLISAIRHEDQVLAVMPYSKHQDFRQYYRTLSLPHMKHYFKCLFSALADCHSLGIMHRDVKPANFLFNTTTLEGTLCDFGLAQRLSPTEWHAKCLHTYPQLWKPAAAADGDRVFSPDEYRACTHGAKIDPEIGPIDVLAQNDATRREFAELGYDEKDVESGPAGLNGRPLRPWIPSPRERKILTERHEKDPFSERWEPVTKLTPGRAIGVMKPDLDKRPIIRANRAGTRGFRAPEVLLKCPDQTMSLDIWSVGITMLCFLTRRFPFFQSNDDTEALAEIGAIFGKKKMEKCAAMHNRTFVTNVPSIEERQYSTLHDLVLQLNPNIFMENTPPHAWEHWKEQHGSSMRLPNWYRQNDISIWYQPDTQLFQAIDLMRKCLRLDCTSRITAHEALHHPFIESINEA